MKKRCSAWDGPGQASSPRRGRAAVDRRRLCLVLLAARQAWGPAGFPDALPPPKWRARRAKPRASTLDLMQHRRAELWGEGLRRFRGFPSPSSPTQSPQNAVNPNRETVS